MTTRKRPDVALKRKERAKNDQKVVKCFLSSLLINQDKKEQIIQVIKERVTALSKRQVIASISLNYLIKELFHDVSLDKLNDVILPDILETTFIRQLFLGTDDSRKPFPEIEQFYTRHPYLLQKINEQPTHIGLRNVYSAAAAKFSTNVWNHLWINIKKRVYQFIDEYIIDKDSKSAVLYHIMNWTMTQEKIDIINSLSPQVLDLIKIQKEILGETQIDEKWCKNKSNFNKLLRYSIFISQTTSKKQFNIIPMSKIKNHYITIDSSSLWGIFKEVGLFDKNLETFTALKDDHWRSIIDVSKVQGKNCNFTNTIETDGSSICVHFERDKDNDKVTVTKKKIDTKNIDYWACDPGRTNIFYMVNKKDDGTYKTLKLTRRQYYQESGISKANRKCQIWSDAEEIKDCDLSSYSSKGCNIQNFKMFVYNYLENWDVLWKEYGADKWSKQRMRLYGGKKRVFANFFNKMKSFSEKKIIVGYGSAKFNPTAKNEVAVPTSRAYKECTYRFKTVPVDEFRTSKIFHEDSSTILQTVEREDKKTVVRGLLWYSSTIESESKFVNRDVNAAINILNCLVRPKRPAMLCRSDKNEKIVQTVGKIILC